MFHFFALSSLFRMAGKCRAGKLKFFTSHRKKKKKKKKVAFAGEQLFPSWLLVVDCRLEKCSVTGAKHAF